MKKLLFVCAIVTAGLLFSNNTSAQTKIGYFDDQLVLSLFPGIQKVDTLLNSYDVDSLAVEYNYTLSMYQRNDSVFRKDSATLAPKARELALNDLFKLRSKLVNWNQYREQMLQARQEELLLPYRQRMAEALREVVAENKYTLVLRSDAVSVYTQAPLLDNLSIRVAIKLKLPLTKEIEDAWKAAGGTLGGTTTTKPAVPKKG